MNINEMTAEQLRRHRSTLVAVARDKSGFPNVSDADLLAARDAGMILRFVNSTGAGVWQLTPLGANLLHVQEPLGAELEAVWDANVTNLYEY